MPRPSRPWRRSAVLLLASGGLLASAACGGDGGGKSSPSSSSSLPSSSAVSTTTTPPPPPPPPPKNPLTGLGPASTHSVVAVKIDDTDGGRPQLNIDKADNVYILQVEGGLTR